MHGKKRGVGWELGTFASARLFALYTEVYCDRISLSVVESPLVVISMLVKIATDLDEVNPESYLKQAAEILGKGPIKTAGLSHPEAYIRAHVLQLWHEQAADANLQIAELIEGPPALDELDLTRQMRVVGVTRQLVDAMLAPKWLQTDVILAHARLLVVRAGVCRGTRNCASTAAAISLAAGRDAAT